jgi:ribosome-associated protein YbcJ (S4-like RNA binding protein)
VLFLTLVSGGFNYKDAIFEQWLRFDGSTAATKRCKVRDRIRYSQPSYQQLMLLSNR